jgi:hypothetical protein
LGKEHKFELFGLAEESSVEKAETQYVYYNLYPRKADNSAWCNHTFKVDDKDVRLALFHSWTYKYYGFRVTDFACYERIVGLFKNATHDEEVTVGDKKVSLFGEILISDKPVQA